jgi:hypothetical protein
MPTSALLRERSSCTNEAVRTEPWLYNSSIIKHRVWYVYLLLLRWDTPTLYPKRGCQNRTMAVQFLHNKAQSLICLPPAFKMRHPNTLLQMRLSEQNFTPNEAVRTEPCLYNSSIIKHRVWYVYLLLLRWDTPTLYPTQCVCVVHLIVRSGCWGEYFDLWGTKL